jgi:hypothetical protein
MTILEENEKKFIEYLLNRKINENEKSIIKDFKSFEPTLFDTIFLYISEKEITKNDFDYVFDRMCSMHIKKEFEVKDKGILLTYIPIIKRIKHDIVNFSSNLEEDFIKTSYICEVVSNIKDVLNGEVKILGEFEYQQKSGSWYKCK